MDIFAERREGVVDDAAAAGFDLGGDRHAGGDRRLAAIDQERCAVERDMRDRGRRGIARLYAAAQSFIATGSPRQIHAPGNHHRPRLQKSPTYPVKGGKQLPAFDGVPDIIFLPWGLSRINRYLLEQK